MFDITHKTCPVILIPSVPRSAQLRRIVWIEYMSILGSPKVSANSERSCHTLSPIDNQNLSNVLLKGLGTPAILAD